MKKASFPLIIKDIALPCWWGTKTVPLGVPNYGQAKRDPRGTLLVCFYECILNKYSICNSNEQCNV